MLDSLQFREFPRLPDSLTMRRFPVITALVLVLLLAAPALHAQTADLDKTSRQARALLDEGKFAEALPLLLELRKAAPENTSLGMTIGQAYAATGEAQKAILEYESIRRRLPNFKAAVTSLATLYLNLGQVREGVSLLAEFVGRNPGDADARSLLASAYRAQGDLARSTEQLEEISRLQPANPQAWYALSQAYRAIASESMRRTEEADPESAAMVAMAGLERMDLQQDESAFFLLREALRRNPKLRSIHPEVASIYTRRKQAEWAVTEQARETALGAPDCKAEPAACAYQSGDWRAVMQATRFARLPGDLYWRYLAARRLATDAYSRLQALPASVQGHGAKAEWHRIRNQHTEAVKAWQAALALAPGNLGLRKELVTSLYQARDYAACIAEADLLLKQAPEDAQLLLLRADAALSQQDPQQALPFLERALRAEPAAVPIRASLGRALLQVNRPAEAIPHLEAVLPYASDISVLYQLSQAYQQVGRNAESARMLARYQELLRQEQKEKAELEAKFGISPP